MVPRLYIIMYSPCSSGDTLFTLFIWAKTLERRLVTAEVNESLFFLSVSDDEFENLRIKGPNAVQLVKTTPLKLSPLPTIPETIREVICDMLNALAAYHAPEERKTTPPTKMHFLQPPSLLFGSSRCVLLPWFQPSVQRSVLPPLLLLRWWCLGARTCPRSFRMSGTTCTSSTGSPDRAVTLTRSLPSTSM